MVLLQAFLGQEINLCNEYVCRKTQIQMNKLHVSSLPEDQAGIG